MKKNILPNELMSHHKFILFQPVNMIYNLMESNESLVKVDLL